MSRPALPSLVRLPPKFWQLYGPKLDRCNDRPDCSSSPFESGGKIVPLIFLLRLSLLVKRDYIRKSCLLGRMVLAFMAWTHSARPSLKPRGQQMERKKTIYTSLSLFSAVLNIDSWRVRSALANVVSLIVSSVALTTRPTLSQLWRF